MNTCENNLQENAPRPRSSSSDKFYVYALLDNRNPGTFQYGKYTFNYEPMYIGKGKGQRAYSHLKVPTPNLLKIKLMNKILAATGREPQVQIIRKNLSEEKAFKVEKRLIRLIGRRIRGKGPLTNISKGGEGNSGFHKSTSEFRRELKNSHPNVKLLSRYNGASGRVDLQCGVCAYEWSPPVISLRSGSGCPNCAPCHRKSHDEHVLILKSKFSNIEPLDEYSGSDVKIRYRCITCKHGWSSAPANLLRSKGCRKCFASTSKTGRLSAEEFRNRMRKSYGKLITFSDYVTARTKVTLTYKCGCTRTALPQNLLKIITQCSRH